MNTRNLIDRVLDNWPAKVVCFALAFLLFIFYRLSTLELRYFSVPLTVENDDSFMPSSAYPRTVRITLRGENASIYPVLESDISAYLDLSRISREGEFSIPVQTLLRGTASGSEMIEVSVEPPELILKFEHRITRKIPVEPVFRGEPGVGYEVASFSVIPSLIEVSGPRSLVDKTDGLLTAPVDLSGAGASFIATVPVDLNNSLMRIEGSGNVAVDVAINEKILIRQFQDIPLYFENLDPSLTVIETGLTGRLTLKGTEANLSQWTLPDTALSVFCENIGSPGIYSLPVHAIVPGRFEIQETFPSDVQFTVKRKDQ